MRTIHMDWDFNYEDTGLIFEALEEKERALKNLYANAMGESDETCEYWKWQRFRDFLDQFNRAWFTSGKVERSEKAAQVET